MPQLFTNNARAALLSTISAVDTTILVTALLADTFPTANAGTAAVSSSNNWFKATLQNSTGDIEIVYVRTRSSGSNVFSNVLRGREGTTAREFLAGSVIGLRITAQDYTDLRGLIDAMPTDAVSAASLAASTGAAGVGMDDSADAETFTTAQGFANTRVRVATYADFRACTKATNEIELTGYHVTNEPAGYAGIFVKFNGATPTRGLNGRYVVRDDGAIYVRRGNKGESHVEWYSPDGVNDSVAIQAAVDAVNTARGGTVVFDPTRAHAIGTTVTVDPTTGPINLYSTMTGGEGSVGGYLYPTTALANGMIRYSSATRAAKAATVDGLSFYDSTATHALGAGLLLDDFAHGTVKNCRFGYLQGAAISTDNCIMCKFTDNEIRYCGRNATGMSSLQIGKAGSGQVTQSLRVNGLISEVNRFKPYIQIEATASDIKITGVQFEADTANADTCQIFLRNVGGQRVIVNECGFNRNTNTSLLSDTTITLTDSIFDSDTANGTPKLHIKGQGAVVSDIKLTGGLTNTGYDFIIGDTASPAPVFATVSNISMSYGGGFWEGGGSVIENVVASLVYSVTGSPTGKTVIYLGAASGFPSYLSNARFYLTQTGNTNVTNGNFDNQLVNVTGFHKVGTATINNTFTSVTVTHGVDFTPNNAQIAVFPVGNAGDWWIDNVGATTFRINVATTPGVSVSFGWRVQY